MLNKEMLITEKENQERRWYLEKTMERIKFVMTKEQMERIHIGESVLGDEMVVDLHGMGTKEAIIFLNNIVNLSKGKCNIKLVHGYNNGIALKDMLERRFSNPKVVDKHASQKNKGATIFKVTNTYVENVKEY